MRRLLDKLFNRDPNDAFLSLMQVVREHPETGELLRRLLNQPSPQRQAALVRWIGDLEQQQAPPVFLNAVRVLLDDSVAERTLQLLEHPDQS